MICIPLGLITVATAGTPITLTAALVGATNMAKLPPSGQVAKVDVYPNPAATGVVYVKQAGTIIAALPVPATAVIPWSTPESKLNDISAIQVNNAGGFQLDVATGGDGAYVTLWVK